MTASQGLHRKSHQVHFLEIGFLQSKLCPAKGYSEELRRLQVQGQNPTNKPMELSQDQASTGMGRVWGLLRT